MSKLFPELDSPKTSSRLFPELNQSADVAEPVLSDIPSSSLRQMLKAGGINMMDIIGSIGKGIPEAAGKMAEPVQQLEEMSQEQIAKPIQDFIARIYPEARLGDPREGEPSVLDKARIATQAVLQAVEPYMPTTPSRAAELYAGGKVIGASARQGLGLLAYKAPRKVLATLQPITKMGETEAFLSRAEAALSDEFEKQGFERLSKPLAEEFKDFYAMQIVRRRLGLGPAGTMSPYQQSQYTAKPKQGADNEAVRLLRQSAEQKQAAGAAQPEPTIAASADPNLPSTKISPEMVNAPQLRPDMVAALGGMAERSAVAPAVDQAPVHPMTGSDVGDYESFKKAMELADSGEIDLSEVDPEMFSAMQEFWSANPTAKTGIIQPDGSIQPVIDAAATVSDIAGLTSAGPSGPIASMTPEQFTAAFPDLPPEIHKAEVRGAMMASLEVAPSVVEYYDLATDVQEELNKKLMRGEGKSSDTPLMDAIRAKGGISAKSAKTYGGELENALRHNLMRRKGGMSIPELAEALHSEGMLDKYDENELFKKLDDEARMAAFGKPAMVGEGAGYGVQEKTDTPEFKKWFGESKVVDEAGEPMVVYHGTTGDFTTFDRARANVESDFGAGFYFTNTKEDVAANYAGFGPDLTNKIELRAERIEQERSVSMEEARSIAKEEFAAHGGATIPAYLKMDNPVVVGGDGETFFDYTFKENRRTGEMTERGKLVDFIVALRDVASRFQDGSVDDAIQGIMEKAQDYEGLKASELIGALKDSEQFSYFTDDNGNLAGNEIIRQALEASGFDGVIDRTVDIKFGSQRRIGKQMEGMHEGTVHYIAFRSEQIKSVFNRGTFDPKDPNILKESESYIAGGPHYDPRSAKQQLKFDLGESAISAKIVKNGKVDLKGQIVKTVQDWGEVAAILRNPLTENLGVFFGKKVAGGVQILGHHIYSSGLPDAVGIDGKMVASIEQQAKDMGADVIYYAHNHPSGNPKESREDLNMTRKLISFHGEKMRGMVITDDKQFNYVGVPGGIPSPILTAYKTPKESFPQKGRGEPILEQSILVEKMAESTKAIKKGSTHIVIYTDSHLKSISVQAVDKGEDMPTIVAAEIKRLKASNAFIGVLERPSGYKGDFPSEVLDVVQMGPDGKFIGAKKPGDIRISNRSAYGDISTYRVGEPIPPYNDDEFRAFIIGRKLKVGDELTVRVGINANAVKDGRIPKGRKVKIVAFSQEGGMIAVRPVDSLPGSTEVGFASPQSFRETFVVAAPKPSPKNIKAEVEKVTGVKPSPTEEISGKALDMLRAKFKAMEKGSRWGFWEGARQTRTKIMQRFRNEKETLADIRGSIVDYINDNLAREARGEFLRMVANAKTVRDLDKAFVRVDDAASKVYRKGLVEDIKVMADRALSGKSVAVEYRKKIKNLLSAVEWSGHRQDTLDRLKATQSFIDGKAAAGQEVQMPQEVLNELNILFKRPVSELGEPELETVLDSMKQLVEIGKTFQNVRASYQSLKKQNILAELVNGTVGIDSKEAPKVPALAAETFEQSLSRRFVGLSNWLQDKGLSITPMAVFFDRMDGDVFYRGANYKHFMARMNAGYGAYLNRADAMKKSVIDMARTLRLSELNFKRIGIHAVRVQKGGVERLIDSGITQKEIDSVSLSSSETKLYLEMRKQIESVYPEVSKLMAELYNEEIGKVQHYFPFHTEFEKMTDLEVFDRLRDTIGVGHLKKSVERGFSISRVKGAKTAVKINAMDIFLHHVDDTAYFVEMQRDIKMMSEVAKSEAYQEVAGDLGGRNVVLWMDVMARKGGANGAKRVAWIDMLRRNIGAATLALKLNTVMIQVSSLFNGAAMITGEYVTKGVYDVMQNEWRAFLKANIPELRHRIGDDQAYADLSTDSWLGKMQRVGFGPLQWVDAHTACAVCAGAYRKAVESKGGVVDLLKPDQEALDYANLVLRRTQASALFKDVSLALSRGGFTGNVSLDRAIFQFQTFMLNAWSFLRHDVVRLGLKGEGPGMGAGLSYLAMSAVAETGIRGLSGWAIAGVLGGLGLAAADPDERDPFYKRALMNMLQMVPWMSPIISMSSFGSIPVPVISEGAQFAKGVNAFTRANTGAAKVRGVVMALESLASLAGVPGTKQLVQLYRKANQSKRLTFPFSEEMAELEATRKESGHLTEDEAKRLGALRMADKKFDMRRRQFKMALEKGDMDRAREVAKSARKDLEHLR